MRYSVSYKWLLLLKCNQISHSEFCIESKVIYCFIILLHNSSIPRYIQSLQIFILYRKLAYVYRNTREDQLRKYKPVSDFIVWQFVFSNLLFIYSWLFLISQLPFQNVKIDTPICHLQKKAQNKNHCRHFKQKGIKFREVSAYKFIGRARESEISMSPWYFSRQEATVTSKDTTFHPYQIEH